MRRMDRGREANTNRHRSSLIKVGPGENNGVNLRIEAVELSYLALGQSFGSWSDQTSLLNGWAWPPAMKSLS